VRPFLVRDTDIKFISEEEHRQINTRCNPEKGDVLYTKVGATFSYAAVVELDYSFSIFVSLALLKPVTPYFSSAFAELVMNSTVIFKQARERVSGIGTPDLHLIEIRDFRAPLPPLPEQQEIVRRVGALLALADQLEARYAKAKAYVEKLAPSLLARAFRGELVPQDPNDEPASVLLKRIREKSNGSVQSSRRRSAAGLATSWPSRF
jgi:type I restriction enzyme S subunit